MSFHNFVGEIFCDLAISEPWCGGATVWLHDCTIEKKKIWVAGICFDLKTRLFENTHRETCDVSVCAEMCNIGEGEIGRYYFADA